MSVVSVAVRGEDVRTVLVRLVKILGSLERARGAEPDGLAFFISSSLPPILAGCLLLVRRAREGRRDCFLNRKALVRQKFLPPEREVEAGFICSTLVACAI